jgi:hypothetical protein
MQLTRTDRAFDVPAVVCWNLDAVCILNNLEAA